MSMWIPTLMPIRNTAISIAKIPRDRLACGPHLFPTTAEIIGNTNQSIKQTTGSTSCWPVTGANAVILRVLEA